MSDPTRITRTPKTGVRSPEELLPSIYNGLRRLAATRLSQEKQGGLTRQKVADQLGITERTVKRHLASAKTWLFQRINKDL